MLQDIRFALRTLRRNPGFSAIAILALALGIGATTAIFSLMNAVLLRPPSGIAAPERLFTFERWQAGRLLGSMGYPDFLDCRARLQSFSGLAAEARAPLSFAGGPVVEPLSGALVSEEYFRVLGVTPALGRLLSATDAREPVAVLSHALWQRAFAGDAAIAGHGILINGQAFTVAGVVPAAFRGIVPQSKTDLWLPIALQPIAIPRMSADTLASRASGWLRVFGRLRPGVSIAAAQAEVRTVAAGLAREYPITNQSRAITLMPGVGMGSESRAELRRFLSLLLLCVAVLQLVACANVANLLLARAASRQREIAVRLALGAGRMRLWRSLLTEGLVLWSLAGALGLWLAPIIARAAASVRQPAYALGTPDVHPDIRVMAFALLLTLSSGLAFSAVPAWQGAGVDLVTRLKDGSPGSGRARSRLRGTLIAVQIALSLVLLAAAGTVLRTMERALAANPVAHPEEVLLCWLDLSLQGYTPEQGARFEEALLDRVRAIPGVSSATFGFTIPPEESPARRAIFEPGQEPPQEVLQGRGFEIGTWVDFDMIGPEFFHTLGIPLVQGREFSRKDRAGSPPVAIVNQSLAARLWPRESPIGRRIAAPEWSGPRRPPVEIVGVIRDVPSRSLLGGAPLQLYVPASQSLDLRSTLVVRSRLDSSTLAPALRDIIRQLDPRVPLFNFQAMPEHIRITLWRQRIAAGLLGIFGLLGVVLVGMGVYGVVAHSVTQRTREIGIRMAIGAGPEQISALAIRGAFVWIAAGLAAGLPAAGLAVVVMQKAIPGVRSFEPLAMVLTPALLVFVGLAAAYLPARRASRIEPLLALRCE